MGDMGRGQRTNRNRQLYLPARPRSGAYAENGISIMRMLMLVHELWN